MAAALCAAVTVLSCSTISLALAIPSKESWSSRKTAVKGTVSLGAVSVDTVSVWNSLEREIAGILPLLLLEKGYRVPDGNALPADAAAHGSGGEIAGQDILLDKNSSADFTADVSLIEREYMEGWQTKRSISVELRIWDAGKTAPPPALPLAAGRAMLAGSTSLASSQTANKLLRLALSQALSSLEKSL
jgi:hypothetical protein